MKTILSYLFLLLITTVNLFSQNMVLNSSFENYTTCPTEEGQIDLASPWFSSNGGTADLFSTCATNASEVSVPDNVKGGTQLPLTGNNYSGIRVFANESNIGTEYLGAELFIPLVAGRQYKIIFNVVLSDESEYAISNLGMHLSTNKLTQTGGVFNDVTPQIINENGFLTSTDKWTQITSCYIATGDERFLTIGNFNSDQNTSAKQVSTSSSRDQDAYYMIDDVSITEVNYKPTLGYDSLVCQIDAHTYEIDTRNALFSLFPNADISFPNSGNQILDTVLQFPLEITDGNCVFYDTATFYEQIAIEIDLGLDTNLCPQDTIALISSTEGANLWSTGEITDTIYVFEEGIYHVVFTEDLCETTDTVSVHTLEQPNVTLPDSIYLCDGESQVLNASFEFSEYTWQDHSKNSSYTVTEQGNYSVTIENKCGIDTAESYVSYDLFQNMFFPNAITPNNDGLNDNFKVQGGENCKLEFKVINRWGGQVYYNNDYKNDWPDQELSTGTYFYSISAEHFDCKQKGWIQIIR